MTKFQNSSKPFTFLVAVEKSKRFLISPILATITNAQLNQIRELKKKIVELGGSEVDKVAKPHNSLIPSSLTPEIPIISSHRSRLEYVRS